MCVKKKRRKKNCCHLNYCCARVCSFCLFLSLVSVCVKGCFLSLFLSHSLLQRKSSPVFVSSAVLLLLFSNLNHERKIKLTWWIYKFSPSLLTFVCIFFYWKYSTHTHHTHTQTHTHTRTLHTHTLAFIVGPTVCYHYLLSHCFTPHSCHIHFICWFVFV